MNRFATEPQLLLLRAALLTGSAASEAAGAWFHAHRQQAQNGFRSLDPASRRLLPLVHKNVKDGIPAEIRKELLVVHHHYWAENQKLFHKLEAMLQELERAGIPTLVLKGAALSVLHYRDMAARPMSDFDILVPEEHGRALVRQFSMEGWMPDCVPMAAPQTDYFYRFRHALNLVHPIRGTLDLHWHVLLEATYRGADGLFWGGSVPMRLKSVGTRALHPTDQLLHACLHGYPFNPMPPFRWIADAVTILRTSTIDWDRLVQVASELRVTIPCAETLAFLNAALDAGVPPGVISKLATHPAKAAERRYFERMANRGGRRWWETLEDVWTSHGRANRDRPFLKRILLAPRHLQLEQELPNLASLLPHTLVFLKRRFPG